MAGHRIDMLDIQRIIQLKARGESNRSVARLLGINRKTVNEYVIYTPHLVKQRISVFMGLIYCIQEVFINRTTSLQKGVESC